MDNQDGEEDHLSLKNKNEVKKINYPKADGVITFDRLTNVSYTSTYHEENQPCHLKLMIQSSLFQII